MDIAIGGSVPRFSAAAGLFRDPVTGVAHDVDLQQAFASYVASIGSGLRVDVGKFVTHCGLEVIEGYDGWNDDATRSLLFGYAIPFTHTGVRATYKFGPRLAELSMVVDGWDDATNDNRAKSVGGQLTLTPTPALAIYLNGLVGAERPDDDRHLRSLGGLVITYKPAPRMTLGVNADLAREQGLLAPAESRAARWSAVAGYARWRSSDRFALTARAESFADRDGARTGLVQTLAEVTLTPELKLTPDIIVRADLKTDRSNRDAFPSASGVKDSQTKPILNALAALSASRVHGDKLMRRNNLTMRWSERSGSNAGEIFRKTSSSE